VPSTAAAPASTTTTVNQRARRWLAAIIPGPYATHTRRRWFPPSSRSFVPGWGDGRG
jgi:hypothetical protein